MERPSARIAGVTTIYSVLLAVVAGAPQLAGAYIAYVLLNAFVVLAALLVFHRLVAGWVTRAVWLVALASFLLANDVVKAFFWTPHTQMFHVLLPNRLRRHLSGPDRKTGPPPARARRPRARHRGRDAGVRELPALGPRTDRGSRVRQGCGGTVGVEAAGSRRR